MLAGWLGQDSEIVGDAHKRRKPGVARPMEWTAFIIVWISTLISYSTAPPRRCLSESPRRPPTYRTILPMQKADIYKHIQR